MSAPRMVSTSPTASAKSERSASSGSTRSSSSSGSTSLRPAAAGAGLVAGGLGDDAAIGDRVWARAIHAVTEQKLSLRSVARLYGLHHMALYRRVRARQSVQQSLQAHHRLSLEVSTPNGSASGSGYGRMAAATERFEPPARLPERLSDLDGARLSVEQNDEAMSLLYEDYGPSIVRRRRADGSTGEDYCFDDDDIRDVVRFIVGRDARRELPAQFPSQRWLAAFKRENRLADGMSAYQEDAFHHQFQYSATLNGHEQQQQQQSAPQWAYSERRGSTTAAMRSTQAPRESANDRDQYYSTSEDESNHSSPRQRPSTGAAALDRQQQVQQPEQQQLQTDKAEGKMYRQSNTVPSEVWDKAMEDVLIHGMSLRNAAKVHGVHFAALHRRLKKRSLQKEAMPFDPRYIPFEDEAGLIRVINARADLGVLMSYQEVVDLLRRATLNHRSELSDDDSVELIRKFRSRVEASIRHLVKDWPLPAVDALYQQLGPVPAPATTLSVSPRVVLPPASSLRSPNNGVAPGLSALVSPREWPGHSHGDNVNGLGRAAPSSNAPRASSPTQSTTILRL